MKWNKLLAAIILTAGIGYTSYSLTSYFQQRNLVQEIMAEEQKNFLNRSSYLKDSTDQEIWTIFPTEERPKYGEHFADLYIPRLNYVLPIVEGTDEEELEKGVGHYAGSVLPGEPDNAVLSGHRDTVFRQMGKMQVGDELHVGTSRGKFIYEIQKMWITDSEDRSVIVPHDKPVLTLTTCYPFHIIGPAPQRYIIQAELKQRI